MLQDRPVFWRHPVEMLLVHPICQATKNDVERSGTTEDQLSTISIAPLSRSSTDSNTASSFADSRTLGRAHCSSRFTQLITLKPRSRHAHHTSTRTSPQPPLRTTLSGLQPHPQRYPTRHTLFHWNLWGLRHLIYPFKLLTVAFHEFSHAAVGCCTGAKIESITLDPNEGGLTRMRGGIQACTLPAGYLGSSLIGALLIFTGFNIVASKVSSIVLAVVLLITLWWARNWLTRGVVVGAIVLMVAFWFIDHGNPLRFYVLFNGVMSCLYSVWDIMDDLIFRKVNESDASQFAKLCPIIPSSRVWGVIWLLISIIFMAGGVLAGLAAFKESSSEQAAASKSFLPTRF